MPEPVPAARAEDGFVTLPIALTWCGEQPLISFGDVPVNRLDAPFWNDVLAERARIKGFAALDSLDLDDRDIGLAGALFHTNRCGSTLIVRQFSALPRVVALGEPFAFQHLLEGPPAPAGVTRRRLRQLLCAHRDGLAPVADRFVIKWPGLLGQHALRLEEALPEVPMLFVYRHATEVLESIRRRPLGGLEHARPAHDPIGLASPETRAPEDRLGTSARLIAANCARVASTHRVRALGYEHLPDASWSHVAPHFGFDLKPADRDAMRAAAMAHSKDASGGRLFEADGRSKRESAPPRVRTLARDVLGPAIAAAVRDLSPLIVPAVQTSPGDEDDAE